VTSVWGNVESHIQNIALITSQTPPVAMGDTYSMTLGETSIQLNPLTNDYDQNYLNLIVLSIDKPPLHGTATIILGGTAILYSLNPFEISSGFTGIDQYTIENAAGVSSLSSAIVTIIIPYSPLQYIDSFDDGSYMSDIQISSNSPTIATSFFTTPTINPYYSILGRERDIIFEVHSTATTSNDSNIFQLNINDEYSGVDHTKGIYAPSSASILTPAGSQSSITFQYDGIDNSSQISPNELLSRDSTYLDSTIFHQAIGIAFTLQNNNNNVNPSSLFFSSYTSNSPLNISITISLYSNQSSICSYSSAIIIPTSSQLNFISPTLNLPIGIQFSDLKGNCNFEMIGAISISLLINGQSNLLYQICVFIILFTLQFQSMILRMRLHRSYI
jgi:hypothetical protein